MMRETAYEPHSVAYYYLLSAGQIDGSRRSVERREQPIINIDIRISQDVEQSAFTDIRVSYEGYSRQISSLLNLCFPLHCDPAERFFKVFYSGTDIPGTHFQRCFTWTAHSDTTSLS